MFESEAVLTAEALAGMTAEVSRLDLCAPDAELVDLIRGLEVHK